MRSEQQVIRDWVESAGRAAEGDASAAGAIAKALQAPNPESNDGRGPRAPPSRARRLLAGFVDVLTTLLLSSSSCCRCSRWCSSSSAQRDHRPRHGAQRLNAQIAELTELLALERASKRARRERWRNAASLAPPRRARPLQGLLDSQSTVRHRPAGQVAALTSELDAERQISQRALSQVELLNQQIAALRRQIAALEDALEASRPRPREPGAIADLGRRLNVALAQRVQELSRYRSDFFGRLREILGEPPDIRIVGDRFVFQSEVLFDHRLRTEINPAGRAELDKLADALLELERRSRRRSPGCCASTATPTSAADHRRRRRFRDNWELSAARAISVVRYLIDQGVSPNRLVAAGFGEFQPIDPGDTTRRLPATAASS
jgi:chemotaxis protein MotB